jgi:uncharacterized protein with PhoU and TrkA domain
MPEEEGTAKSEEMLLDLKEEAELMIDLAYSSVIYNNKDLAEEVAELEDDIDLKNLETQRRIFKDVLEGKLDIDAAIILSGLARATESIADGALQIADVELRDVEMHPIVKESVKESDTAFTRVTVNKKSILAGSTLSELGLAKKIGMRVIAVKRGSEWICGPKEKFKINPGDILLAKGPLESEKKLISVAMGRKKRF